MNFFRLLGAIPAVEAQASNIERALKTIEWYKRNPRSQKAVATLRRILNDPDVKDAIAFFQDALKDPNVTAAIDTARTLDQILINEGIGK
jgi:hypothetical protein